MGHTDLQMALDRLDAGAASDDDAAALRAALSTGQIVIGSGNVTAGRDIVDSNILQVASAEAMTSLLAHLFPQRVNTLPPPPTDFTGRDDEVSELVEQARSSGGFRSSLRGLGGIGKTAIALVVAHHLSPRYPDAALYVNLRGSSAARPTARDAQIRVIRNFDMTAPVPDDPDQLTDLYRRTLADKRGVLLLDDAYDPSQIRPLLPPNGWSLLVTSRQRFHIDGMHVIEIEELPASDSRTLLQRIAGRLTDEQADEIGHFCGHLPLALRLAGGFLQSRPAELPDNYIRRLHDETRRIERLDAALQLDPEQPGLEATLQISS